ncbi:hypothetical protein OKW40_001487 [Paraburkholderia sp. RAU6.4a]
MRSPTAGRTWNQRGPLQHRHEARRHCFRNRLQRALRGRNHEPVDLRRKHETVHRLRWNQDQAWRVDRELFAFDQHVARTAADIENLQQCIVPVRGDMPVVRTTALDDPFEIERVVPRRPRGLSVQIVVRDIPHAVLSPMFELSCDVLPLSNFVPNRVAILFSIEDAVE